MLEIEDAIAVIFKTAPVCNKWYDMYINKQSIDNTKCINLDLF